MSYHLCLSFPKEVKEMMFKTWGYLVITWVYSAYCSCYLLVFVVHCWVAKDIFPVHTWVITLLTLEGFAALVIKHVLLKTEQTSLLAHACAPGCARMFVIISTQQTLSEDQRLQR